MLRGKSDFCNALFCCIVYHTVLSILLLYTIIYWSVLGFTLMYRPIHYRTLQNCLSSPIHYRTLQNCLSSLTGLDCTMWTYRVSLKLLLGHLVSNIQQTAERRQIKLKHTILQVSYWKGLCNLGTLHRTMITGTNVYIFLFLKQRNA